MLCRLITHSATIKNHYTLGPLLTPATARKRGILKALKFKIPYALPKYIILTYTLCKNEYHTQSPMANLSNA